MIEQLFDRPIAFHRSFVKICGSINSALMLSQAVYWSRRTSDGDGWFYKTQSDWEDETGMTRYEQESARKKLRNIGVIDEAKRGVPCKTYYRVNAAVLDNLLIQYAEKPHTRSRKSSKQGSGKTTDSAAGNQQSITETTHNTTTETTTLFGTQSAPAAEQPAKPSKKRGKIPDDFRPSQQHIELANSLRVNLEVEFPAFADYHRAKGSVMADWHAALRTWIRNSVKFRGGPPPGGKAGNAYFRKPTKDIDYHEGVRPDGKF